MASTFNDTDHYEPHVESGVVECVQPTQTSNMWSLDMPTFGVPFGVPGRYRDVTVFFQQPYVELPKVHVSANRMWQWQDTQGGQLGVDGSTSSGNDNLNFGVEVLQVYPDSFTVRCFLRGHERLVLKGLNVDWLSIL